MLLGLEARACDPDDRAASNETLSVAVASHATVSPVDDRLGVGNPAFPDGTWPFLADLKTHAPRERIPWQPPGKTDRFLQIKHFSYLPPGLSRAGPNPFPDEPPRPRARYQYAFVNRRSGQLTRVRRQFTLASHWNKCICSAVFQCERRSAASSSRSRAFDSSPCSSPARKANRESWGNRGPSRELGNEENEGRPSRAYDRETRGEMPRIRGSDLHPSADVEGSVSQHRVGGLQERG